MPWCHIKTGTQCQFLCNQFTRHPWKQLFPWLNCYTSPNFGNRIYTDAESKWNKTTSWQYSIELGQWRQIVCVIQPFPQIHPHSIFIYSMNFLTHLLKCLLSNYYVLSTIIGTWRCCCDLNSQNFLSARSLYACILWDRKGLERGQDILG